MPSPEVRSRDGDIHVPTHEPCMLVAQTLKVTPCQTIMPLFNCLDSPYIISARQVGKLLNHESKLQLRPRIAALGNRNLIRHVVFTLIFPTSLATTSNPLPAVASLLETVQSSKMMASDEVPPPEGVAHAVAAHTSRLTQVRQPLSPFVGTFSNFSKRWLIQLFIRDIRLY